MSGRSELGGQPVGGPLVELLARQLVAHLRGGWMERDSHGRRGVGGWRETVTEGAGWVDGERQSRKARGGWMERDSQGRRGVELLAHQLVAHLAPPETAHLAAENRTERK